MAAVLTVRGVVLFFALMAGLHGSGCASRGPRLGCAPAWEAHADESESTTLLPPGWRVAGTARPDVEVGDGHVAIPLHIAENPGVPGVVYVNAPGPEKMYGWWRAPVDDGGEGERATGAVGDGRVSAARESDCPPSAMIVTALATEREPSSFGQGVWIGNHVLTARHVVDSLWLDGARVGVNGTYVGARVVDVGAMGEPGAAVDSMDAELALRKHDWALLEVDGPVAPACAAVVAGSGRVRRMDRLYVVGYEPDVPGGGLTWRPLRVIAMTEDANGQAAYYLVNDGRPTKRGWSGSFVGRKRASGGWEFVGLVSSMMKVKDWECVTAVRPPREVVDRVFGTMAAE